MHLLKQTAAAALGMALLLGVVAITETSAQTISRYVIGNGGSLVIDNGGTMTYGGTVGQAIVGVSGYEPGATDIFHGFWYVDNASIVIEDVVTAGSTHWNSPNPFATTTTINFAIPNSSTVRVRVYDMEGTLITTLADKSMTSGSHQVSWNGTNGVGDEVASGYYFYTIDAAPTTTGGQAMSIRGKMLLMK